MKSNKGFTLIELLAVIVILAIIALIATPTILGVIETARKGSAESSALGYIDAVEKQIAIDMLDEAANAKVTITDGEIAVPAGATMTVKGTTPSAGTIKVDAEKGVITKAALEITLSGKKYCVQYNGTKATATAMTGEATCTLAA